ncbi:hypothetical protein [Dethiobacter alkaliphilus]|uniref:hypothetical protein n=1 Tax=Dethiobacter alkaliphilus TaxID=427926 RepID=UPI001375D706|nr:hypothetical protein [Dethiobacter alkaliphilus]
MSSNSGTGHDFQNRMTGIITPTAEVAYTYDGDGRKVSRTSTLSGELYYLYDGATVIMESTTSDFASVVKYTAGLEGLLNRISADGSEAYYYHDAQGNLGAIADALAELTDTLAYDPWGAVINRTGTTNEQRTYVGKYGVEHDPDAGLLHMGGPLL